MDSGSPIQFFKEGVALRLLNQSGLKQWILKTCKAHSVRVASLNFVFCSDRYLLNMNKQYLKHNYLTDIITFDNSMDKGSELEGDIFISVDRIVANSKKYNVTFREELHRVMIHGVLHLLGYNDKKPAEVKAMRKAEEAWMAKRGFLKSTRRR